ncbi:MAG TPA: hypothetical protein VKE24_16880 [Candidatus Acidoferrales bacterium]|nr:hypothetical protein [Candidatus Acidoferrales bacterium]
MGRLVIAALALAAGPPARSEQTGAIEFVARVTPSAGRPEPARQLTFYLLRKSFAEIQKEAEESEPKPNMDQFIEGLSVSEELKAWMKKNHSVNLAGSEFARKLTADDILNVKEFYDAYLKRNSGGTTPGFPTPKYRAQDAQQNPEKYKRQMDDYHKLLRKYIEANPASPEEIDVELEAINPGPRWAQRESEHRRRSSRRTLQLIQTRYVVAKTDTDLEGRGSLTGILPGDYWLSTLDTDAVAGDIHLRWDLPVTVQAGQPTPMELSNLNALDPQPATR